MVIQGNSTSYSPEAGLRWEWQLQTTMERLSLNPGDISTAGWSPDLTDEQVVPNVQGPTANNPWYYLTTLDGHVSDGTTQPTGWTIVDTRAPRLPGNDHRGRDERARSASVTPSTGLTASHPTNPASKDRNGHTIDPWTFMYAIEAELTLTNSVKADNPIGISFSGADQAVISITSNQPVILAGNIANPHGDTTITAPSITQNASATLTSNNLTLNATGRRRHLGPAAKRQPDGGRCAERPGRQPGRVPQPGLRGAPRHGRLPALPARPATSS